MNFTQYLANENAKTLRLTEVAMLNTGANDESLDIALSHVNPNVMTGRTINGVKYCFFNKKYLNLTELANQIRALYISKGYMGLGFSKLSDSDFVKYSTSKIILDSLFKNDLFYMEIDPKQAAKYFLAAEYVEFG